jgi:nicotinamide-nucleotide amidase
MPSAEIITIGTELLLGEIVDTNAHYLARALRDVGIDLYRKTTVGENASLKPFNNPWNAVIS